MGESILTNSLNSTVISILLVALLFIALIYMLDRKLVPHLRLSSRWSYYGIAFISLPLVYFIAVWIFPMLEAFHFSFLKYNILSPEKPFIGIKNYEYIFSNEAFWQSLANSLRFTLFRVPLVFTLSLITAMMLRVVTRGKNLLRILILLPYMTSGVALGWIFNFIYSRQGITFPILQALGWSQTQSLLTLNVHTAIYAIAFVSAWQAIGYYTLLFTVGLDAIPSEIYDAAKVDGADSWNIFWKITMPLLNPTIVLVSILAVTASLKNFDLIRVMSANRIGGPMNSTLTMPLYIYLEAFSRLNMGRAAAVTIVFFFIILAITLIQFKVTQRPVE